MAVSMAKVTSFITRSAPGGPALLLIEHPFAGIQIPAGTIEAGETPEAAAQREAREETGLEGFMLRAYLGQMEEHLPEREQRPPARCDRLQPARPEQLRLGAPATRNHGQRPAPAGQFHPGRVRRARSHAGPRLRNAANHRLGAG